ncbi:MAG: nuclease, partial [Erysipelotrichaceae bacterium]|nr:nuclease [Erysipelotrichaceae bacterium]
FISKHDVIGQGKASYHINRTIAETGEVFEDGSHIIYVNGSYRGDDPIGKLMHDLHCQNPNDMYYEELARITRYYKENKEGNEKMCQAMEEFEQRAIQKGIVVGITEIVKRMLASKNFTFEQIAQLTGITVTEIHKIAQDESTTDLTFA